MSATRKPRSPGSGIIPVRDTFMGREPPTAEEKAELAAEITRRREEWPTRLAARLTPEQWRKLRQAWAKKKEPKKSRGGRLKWSKDRYIVMLLHLAGWRLNGLTRGDALRKLEVLEGVSLEQIERRFTEARKQVRPLDLPEWAQWVLIKGANPPANR